MATLTLKKSRHRAATWTIERRMFDAWFPRSIRGKHVAN